MLKRLRKLIKGPYTAQFTPERLQDAMALLQRDWAHFAGSPGEMPMNRRWLPQQLAVELHTRGLRPHVADGAPGASGAPGAGFDDLPAALRAPGPPPPLIQRAHSLASRFGIVRGAAVELRTRPGPPPRTDAEFEARPLVEGHCVVTFPAPHSPLGKAVPRLATAPFWVWRILRVFQPGSVLPDNSRRIHQLDEVAFEAQLLAPTAPRGPRARMHLCWDVVPKAVFLRTPAEKAAFKDKQAARAGKRKRSRAEPLVPDRAHRPLTAFLRTGNVLGGAFCLTAPGAVPRFVHDYACRKLAPAAPGAPGAPPPAAA